MTVHHYSSISMLNDIFDIERQEGVLVVGFRTVYLVYLAELFIELLFNMKADRFKFSEASEIHFCIWITKIPTSSDYQTIRNLVPEGVAWVHDIVDIVDLNQAGILKSTLWNRTVFLFGSKEPESFEALKLHFIMEDILSLV